VGAPVNGDKTLPPACFDGGHWSPVVR
jgi:hypothetical protein